MTKKKFAHEHDTSFDNLGEENDNTPRGVVKRHKEHTVNHSRCVRRGPGDVEGEKEKKERRPSSVNVTRNQICCGWINFRDYNKSICKWCSPVS